MTDSLQESVERQGTAIRIHDKSSYSNGWRKFVVYALHGALLAAILIGQLYTTLFSWDNDTNQATQIPAMQPTRTVQVPAVIQPQPSGPTYLDTSAFITRTFGKFEPFTVRNRGRIGPINLYDGSCPYWYKSGIGQITILSRPDFTSEPVPAVMHDDGYGVKSWGHPGPAYQLFFESTSTNQIELERREGNDSCTS